MVKALPPKDTTINVGHLAANSDANWPGMDSLARAKDLLSSRSIEPGSSSEVMCEEMMPSDESNETNSKQVDSYLDTATEDLSSDSSDYCGEGDEDVSVRTKECFCFVDQFCPYHNTASNVNVKLQCMNETNKI